ncbi:glutathione S-transferase [Parvibaculaceae bacterium PLY_AMNH_Bact1]|nr:glutathione S-transferase [Parvibaculaceae bacterium PLY_AMNH_Bact1]
MTQDLPILYSFRRCPYAMRARLALAVSGQSVALREVVLRDKPPEMIDVSPKATVPVLVLGDGTVLEESLDVMNWALAQADPEGWLDVDRNIVGELVAENDGPFKHHLDRYKYANRYDGAVAEAHRAEASKTLSDLNARLEDADWLCGPSASFADYAILPFVRQFANTDRSWFDAQDWPHLRSWLERFLASDRFQSVMKKYPQWSAGDLEPIFPEA